MTRLARGPFTRSTPRRARGYAIAILLVLVTMGALTALVQQLNSASAQGLFRDSSTQEQLRAAKLALIDYSANHSDRPGGMPCPARDNTGQAAASCANANEQIGRLPWATLKLPAPRIDSALWYAMSERFQIQGKEGDAASVWAINSTTLGELSLTSTATTGLVGNDFVAVIIHPGQALASQTRPPGGWNTGTTITQYLESENADAANNRTFSIGQPTPFFNDAVVGVTHDELFDVVEAVVESRIKRSVWSQLVTYHQGLTTAAAAAEVAPNNRRKTSFGAYPYPAKFSNPHDPAKVYEGQSSADALQFDGGLNSGGLLPVGGAVPALWTIVTSSPCTLPVGFSGCTVACTPTPTPPALPNSSSCVIHNPSSQPAIFTIRLTVANGARSFLLPVSFHMLGEPVEPGGITIFGWEDATMGWPGAPATERPRVIHSLQQDGTAQIDLEGVIDAGVTKALTLAAPTARRNPALSDTATNAFPTPFDPTNAAHQSSTAWFMRNRWYENVLYTLSIPASPEVSGNCEPPGGPISSNFCLTVVYGTIAGKPIEINTSEVALILMGRPVRVGTMMQDRTTPGTPGPSDLLTNYVEGENLNRPTYEHRVYRNQFNDRVIHINRP